jgi:hypothetical protein
MKIAASRHTFDRAQEVVLHGAFIFFSMFQVVGESGLVTPEHISFVQNAGVKAVSHQPQRRLQNELQAHLRNWRSFAYLLS